MALNLFFLLHSLLHLTNYLSNEFYRESYDLAYEKLGNYYSNLSSETSFGLKTPTEVLNHNLISSDSENFYLKNINNLKTTEKLFNLSLKNSKLNFESLDLNFSLSVPALTTLVSVDGALISQNQNSQSSVSSDSDITSFQELNTFKSLDLDNFVSIGSCGTESFGSKYTLEKKNNSYTLISNNIVSCLNFDLRDFFKNKKFDFYSLKFKALNQNSNSYYCVLENEGKECNKIKLANLNQLVLDPKATNLVFFNEPITNLEATSIFSEVEIKTLSKLSEVKVGSFLSSVKNNNTLILKKDKNLTGNLAKFGFNPKVCQTNDFVTLKTGFFESSEFNLCDNYNIDYDSKNYRLVEITSKNTSGLPIRVCLQNSDTQRCDLFMALPKNKEFKSDYLLLPPFSGPHNLALTNQVIEGNTSKNEVSYLSIKEIDYPGLFNLGPENSKRVFVYHKAYEKGFIALCGAKICPFERVLVNNWANGWVIPDGYPIKETEILVIFWPNFLAFFGFIGFFIFLFIAQAVVKSQNKPIAIDKS